MTPGELKHFEAAARDYCTRIGIDPDTTRPMPHPTIVGYMTEVPAWHHAAEDLHDFALKMSCLKKAAQAAANDTGPLQ